MVNLNSNRGDKFQSYQSKQINPDIREGQHLLMIDKRGFQSYQSKQINPDFPFDDKNRQAKGRLFQSYQSKQINPDMETYSSY